MRASLLRLTRARAPDGARGWRTYRPGLGLGLGLGLTLALALTLTLTLTLTLMRMEDATGEARVDEPAQGGVLQAEQAGLARVGAGASDGRAARPAPRLRRPETILIALDSRGGCLQVLARSGVDGH